MNSSKLKPNHQTNLAKKTFEDADSQTRQALKDVIHLRHQRNRGKELVKKNLTNAEELNNAEIT
ncbi:hypothetical protein [Vibrio atlanticus]|uniref:hypothetical protein n=1 Tax=Vibrio atlanticus TaxID=693153 RepID=UPI003551DD3D